MSVILTPHQCGRQTRTHTKRSENHPLSTELYLIFLYTALLSVPLKTNLVDRKRLNVAGLIPRTAPTESRPKSDAHFTLKVVQQHRKATGLIKFKYRIGHARCRLAPLTKRKALGKRGERTCAENCDSSDHAHIHALLNLHQYLTMWHWPCAQFATLLPTY